MLRRVYFAVFIMGFATLAAQTVLIREFFVTFNGNELTIGIVLGAWILMEAAGSLIGGYVVRKTKNAAASYAFIQFAVFIFFPAVIYLIRAMKALLGFGVGESVGNLFILSSSLAVILPLGIPMGMLFPLACAMARRASGETAESIGAVYFTEALGFMAAGPVITYILITKFNSFSIAFLMSGLMAASLALILARKEAAGGPRVLFGISALLALSAILSATAPSSYLNTASLGLQWRGQKLLHYENSIHGNLAAAGRLGQYTFYSNGMPIISSPDPDIWHTEDLVHFAMASHPDPKTVLLIGGGAGGVVNEVLKYPVEKLIYAELDPQLIRLIESFPTELTKKELSDRRLEIKYIDGALLARKMASFGEKVDVVMLNLPIPSTLQLNRFYTKEFYDALRRILPEDGILVFTLPGSPSAMSPEMTDLNGVILKTLKIAFKTFVVPGYSNVYLASPQKFVEAPPALLLERMGERGVTAKLFNRQYAEDRMGEQWVKWFGDSISRYKGGRINSDLVPVGTYYAVSYLNSMLSPETIKLTRVLAGINLPILLLAILAAGFLAIIVRKLFGLNRKFGAGWAVLTTGFTGMSLNLMVIYAYQSFMGFVFSHIALLIAAFMAGLSLGGYAMTRSLKRTKDAPGLLVRIETLAAASCIAMALLLAIRIPSWIYFAAVSVPGILAGLEFPLANKIYIEAGNKNETGGLLYAVDLLGSWGAALATSFVLVPLVGILGTCIALAALKTLSLALVASSKD